MFSSRANSSVGITVAAMMMIPPMVGVPFFCNCPSKPRSRTSSPTCLRRRMLISRLPKVMVISSDRSVAIPARNEIN